MFQSVFSLMSWLLVEFSRAPFLVNCFHLREILFFLFACQLLGNPHLAIMFIGLLTQFLWVWFLVDYSISLLVWFLCSFIYV